MTHIQAILAEFPPTWTITEPHKYQDATVYTIYHPHKQSPVTITIQNNEPHLIRICPRRPLNNQHGYPTNPTIDLNHPNSIEQLHQEIIKEFNTRPNK